MPDDTIRSGGTVLGFDVGARRIGVAVGSPFGHGARAIRRRLGQLILGAGTRCSNRRKYAAAGFCDLLV